MHPIILNEQRLFLHWQKALWWPAQNTLIVADTHFSKDSVFRQHGIAIPCGHNLTDLQRLADLVKETSAQRLLVLGDFIHGRMPANDPFFAELKLWQAQHQALSFEIVAGNHDRHIDKNRISSVTWHRELKIETLCFKHEPVAELGYYTLAGHLHPVVSIRNGRSDRLRLPVLWIRKDYAVVPSFGSMTGGFPIKAEPGERLFAFGQDAVLALQ